MFFPPKRRNKTEFDRDTFDPTSIITRGEAGGFLIFHVIQPFILRFKPKHKSPVPFNNQCSAIVLTDSQNGPSPCYHIWVFRWNQNPKLGSCQFINEVYAVCTQNFQLNLPNNNKFQRLLHFCFLHFCFVESKSLVSASEASIFRKIK